MMEEHTANIAAFANEFTCTIPPILLLDIDRAQLGAWLEGAPGNVNRSASNFAVFARHSENGLHAGGRFAGLPWQLAQSSVPPNHPALFMRVAARVSGVLVLMAAIFCRNSDKRFW
jgi:hypothetical protein